MQYCRGGKNSKCFFPGNDFTEQIFTGELSGVDSAGVLRQSVIKSRVISITSKILKELKLRLLELNEIFMQTL